MKRHFLISLSIAAAFGLIAASGFAAQIQTTASGSTVAATQSQTTQSQSFKVCKSEYALCTGATCSPIPGNDKQVTCHCTVNKGYSVGQKACQAVEQTAAGQQVRSRYYPVKSLAICTNGRAWAGCLDKPCIIDKNNPEAAACKCDVMKDQDPYIIVANAYTPSLCTSGMISSATLQNSIQLTNYLNKSKKWTPFPIQILYGPKKGNFSSAPSSSSSG